MAEAAEDASRARESDTNGLWVFGYGSLCWHQGFDYESSLTGFVEGFSRKFWQGNATHRGTEKKPGRVATLIEDDEGIVWGQAFKVANDKALPYLNRRECELGGYVTTIATFYPRRAERSVPRPFPVVLYVATPSNRLWLGESPLPDIANQILECTGGSGHNVEYLLRLAEFVRENVPEAVDEHLFSLELLVRTGIRERNLSLEDLMGGKQATATATTTTTTTTTTAAAAAATTSRADESREVPASSALFADAVPAKKLRCVNI